MAQSPDFRQAAEAATVYGFPAEPKIVVRRRKGFVYSRRRLRWCSPFLPVCADEGGSIARNGASVEAKADRPGGCPPITQALSETPRTAYLDVSSGTVRYRWASPSSSSSRQRLVSTVRSLGRCARIPARWRARCGSRGGKSTGSTTKVDRGERWSAGRKPTRNLI